LKTRHLVIVTGIGISVAIFFSFFILPSLTEQITLLENYNGIVTLRNQTYYFITPNNTEDAYNNQVQISFHGIVFSLFPQGFKGGLPVSLCDGRYYWADAKFPDATHELLSIFVDNPSCRNSTPLTLSAHTNPQAGLTFYDGKMTLLVRDTREMIS
jgi:hypothetical protein